MTILYKSVTVYNCIFFRYCEHSQDRKIRCLGWLNMRRIASAWSEAIIMYMILFQYCYFYFNIYIYIYTYIYIYIIYIYIHIYINIIKCLKWVLNVLWKHKNFTQVQFAITLATESSSLSNQTRFPTFALVYKSSLIEKQSKKQVNKQKHK